MSHHEQARLYALRQLNLLDTPPSESFDRITRMASQLFNLPIAAVSLTDEDRQWFKSRVGVDHWQIPRFKACCGEVANTGGVLVVPDMLASDVYCDSHLAQSGVRFYAGAPLVTRDGYTLGAMCVLGAEPRAISEQEVATLKDLAAMVMAQIELQHAFGRIDPVTGLPNYSQFLDDLEDEARDHHGADRYGLSLELIDFNEASALQRVMGPTYLDELSRAAAQRLQEQLGRRSKLYHVGPCQFAHILAGVNEAMAVARAGALLEALTDLELGDVAPFLLRPAAGAAPFILGDMKPNDVLRTAHSACRDARQAELSVGVYSSVLDASHKRSYAVLAQFREALQREDQLFLVYQPRIDVASGLCVGAEALIRWHHPHLGHVSPAEFIPLVENTPMARALTGWVITNAVKQAALWQKQGLSLRISINVAAANLQETDFTERLLACLDKENLPRSGIELELTESGLISNGRAAKAQLHALVEAGIHIAIDDFGTGYSSLAYLHKIPAHVVKIDRSFIDAMDREPRSEILVRSMVNMAHDLGYRVVAEGVETLAGVELLRTLGCDEIQGYYFAKPLTVAQFGVWLAQHTAGLKTARTCSAKSVPAFNGIRAVAQSTDR